MQKTVKLLAAITLAALTAFGLTACSKDPGSDGGNTVAATVNGKPIMFSDVEQVITEQTGGKQSQMTQLGLAQARLQVLDSLIQKEVLYQRAENEKLLPTDDEVSQYITAKKQEGGMTEEEFQKRLKETNQSEGAFREEARKLLAIQKLQNKYTASVSISDREVEEAFNANKSQFVLGRGVELAEIVVDPTDNAAQDDAKSEAEAKIKIDNIYQTLKSADFAEIARARSEDPSNVKNGDIGFASEETLKQNGFPPALISQLFGPTMSVGSYTAPVQFNGRWFIFKLKEKRLETQNRTLESPGVRQEITEALRSQRQQLLNAALLQLSLYEAKIVNKLATGMLNNPSNLGLRPAAPEAVHSPAAGATEKPATTPTPAAAAPKTATPGAAATSSASPVKK
ncbi:MAG: Peptidylprolyl isomerase [Acidobacteria bacterium]|nr:Peptidylprolyl isomerase [Acidobacteriota bacterium]